MVFDDIGKVGCRLHKERGALECVLGRGGGGGSAIASLVVEVDS